jgi:DNA recombination protein RmuC
MVYKSFFEKDLLTNNFFIVAVTIILGLLISIKLIKKFLEGCYYNALKKQSNEFILTFEEKVSTLDSLIRQENSTLRSELTVFQESRISQIKMDFESLRLNQERNLNNFREELSKQLQFIIAHTTKSLSEIRVSVEEKLENTISARLGESFKDIGDRLAHVHQGLGEMQTLAQGVGDLKNILINVKTRGCWGELQLENLLSELLTKEQYQKNFIISEASNANVDFAIKIPTANFKTPLWLPIDAKFPIEDYRRIIEATSLDGSIQELQKQFDTTVKKLARDIAHKYIKPPLTTDFAIMFLPTEGLFSEIARKSSLIEHIQREYSVTVCGPTTLSALLVSVRLGLRSVVLHERSTEVWNTLAKVRHEFQKFGLALDQVKKRLNQASLDMDAVGQRSRAVERTLKGVELSSFEVVEDESQSNRALGEC